MALRSGAGDNSSVSGMAGGSVGEVIGAGSATTFFGAALGGTGICSRWPTTISPSSPSLFRSIMLLQDTENFWAISQAVSPATTVYSWSASVLEFQDSIIKEATAPNKAPKLVNFEEGVKTLIHQ